jgi:pheromone shutdown protein TraB
MITLIGVGHVFDIAGRLKSQIMVRSPNLVCIELDRERFRALLERPPPDSRGVPVMYQMLAAFQQRIAEQYGTQVGDEMLAAAEAARELKATLAFIDLDASQIFKEFWGGMSLKEKYNYDCVLLDEDGHCRTYEVRPNQCRTWPFWPTNLESPAAWEDAAQGCPGIGTGPVYSFEVIEVKRLETEL